LELIMAKAAIKTDFTYEAMTQTWEENRAFFQRNEAEFMKKYPGQYVAVHDGEVLLTGPELGPLAGEIYEKYGNIPFYAHVPGEERVEEIDLPLIG
jgi:hypothetical protein